MTVADSTAIATSTSTSTVDLLVAAYRDTLGIAGLDQDSDFYEAGGDSLTAFQITGRLQEALGVEVPVALVFVYPSPADLAAVVDSDFVGA
jgi:acyl carrier protein